MFYVGQKRREGTPPLSDSVPVPQMHSRLTSSEDLKMVTNSESEKTTVAQKDSFIQMSKHK